MKRIDKILMRLVLGLLALPAFTVSCSDEPLPENYYTFTGEMVSDYLQNRPEEFSEFIAILQRSGMYGMMATYGSYTCLAPTNAAVEEYLHSRGLTSVDQLTKEECDTLSWNHIIDDDAYFTTDLIDGNIPSANMNGRNLTFSCDSDAMNNNNVVYYINKTSRMIVWDDSVENGVVHTLDKVVVPQTFYLPDVLAENPDVSLFYEALVLTHLDDSLREYIDESYTCGADSVNQDMTISTGGSSYTMRYVGTRMKRYSAFIETNDVYAQNGINNLDDRVVVHGEGNFSFCFLYQLQDLFRALSQDHPFFCQNDLSRAFCAPDHKLFSKLFFHIFQLGGKSGLGEMERFGRAGNALFPRHSQEILKNTQFHINVPPP